MRILMYFIFSLNVKKELCATQCRVQKSTTFRSTVYTADAVFRHICSNLFSYICAHENHTVSLVVALTTCT